MGYYRPVEAWNEGKREEFKDREYIDLAPGMSDPAPQEAQS